MAGRYTFADAKRWLRKHFPSRRRVRIRLADRAEIDSNTPDAVAVCLFRTRGLCEILIDKAASLDSKIEHLWPGERRMTGFNDIRLAASFLQSERGNQ